jgi:poly-gamma-glutamate capsule biosynthesis protein CapA/YwtB (metallophosphatase superfamily)
VQANNVVYQEVDLRKNILFLTFMKLKKSWATVPILFIYLILIIFCLYPRTLYGDIRRETGDQKKPRVRCVLAVGDIMLTGSAKSLLQARGYDLPFQDKSLARLITSADVAFANLEYPITMKGIRYTDKEYTFRGDPESLSAIRKAGFDFLSLANNHIMDYGEKGLLDTIRLCRKNRLSFAGAGSDLASASGLAVIKNRGVRYGLLAYSLTFPEEFWATPLKPGTAHPDWAQMGQDIRDARQKVDILIVSFHWGEELKSEPKKYQIDFAHHAINQGADIVLGHHPHIPQPIEIFRGKPIFYSLGNYAFGTKSDNAKFSFAPQTRFKDNVPVQVILYPLNVDNQEVGFQPRLVRGTAAKKIITHLMEISNSFGTVINYQDGIGKIMIASENASPSLTASKDENLSSVDPCPDKP